MAVIVDTGKAHTVVVERRRTVAAVKERVKPMPVSSPGPQGRPGEDGAPGPAGAGLTHNQPTPSATWTINHNLGYRPAVELYDAGSQEVSADVQHLNENTVIVTFAVPIAGFARLN